MEQGEPIAAQLQGAPAQIPAYFIQFRRLENFSVLRVGKMTARPTYQ